MSDLSDDSYALQFNKIIGLGEKSTRKSYYPELQKRIAELDLKNKKLLEEIEIRKQAENALAESESLYRTLAERVTEGVMVAIRDEIVYINPALESILKRSKQDLLSMDLKQLFHKDHQDKYEQLLQNYRDGRATDVFTAFCVRGDSRDIWIQGHSQIVEWQGEKATLITARDVTDQIEKERMIETITSQLQQENLLLKSRNMHRYGLGHLVGTSREMQKVYEKIIKAASIDANVVIYGESGTGKELVSRSIHDLSGRNNKPYVAVNCGAIPENLFESEFFGHKKGAFSGASIDKIGFFESADQGTLFLDEVAEIPMNLQVKLLRAIEGSGYTPVGSTQAKQSDVRIIAATNKDLKSMTEQGLIREDFFFRIHIVPIYLPPLKDRKDDIPLLIYHFVQKMGGADKKVYIPDAIVQQFQAHDWPGNVRELQNAVSRYLAFDTVELSGTPEIEQGLSQGLPEADMDPAREPDLNRLVSRYEKQIIQKALMETGGNISKAADLLNIGRRSLQRKIARLGA